MKSYKYYSLNFYFIYLHKIILELEKKINKNYLFKFI
jgi:hypothetical protein